MRLNTWSKALLPLVVLACVSATQVRAAESDTGPIPKQLLGNWRVSKIVPTQTTGCWDQQQAQSLIGGKISYKADAFSWNDTALKSEGATVSTVEAQEFVEDNAGSSSYIDFPMLGISTPSVERVAIQHADTVIKGITDQGTDGVPGDNVLVKDANTLILSLCNVWFEAQREK
ncbi:MULTISPECIES: hypothetical protein [Serratia]|jgi:hypothetical protein|uniref:Lipocalin-like domain-containing protein n=1 Tax=Serratia marcescens TaxID=615 RepID=A0A3E2ELN8_SERMA|nr:MULTISPECIES: hypothetical protein [Serratia]MBM1296125.1 hypothetical protein [Serratia nematodiphila]AWO78856.1 hypothetical protein C1N78_09745 [Serratia marcescens]AXK23691.1 Hypothetical protein SmN45_1909 [Serratia marcescens]EKX2165728.1 hypothetical protein [Serratia marcescens]ELA7781514.1 hypothetical protein [Serratia marcescens]